MGNKKNWRVNTIIYSQILLDSLKGYTELRMNVAGFIEMKGHLISIESR